MPGSPRDKLNNYFNIDAFRTVPADTLGSGPRFLTSYRGPNIVNEDVTLMKNFKIKESKSVQLRLEMYSATNSPQWGNPDTSFGGTSFGQITSTTGQRSVQVAVKFYY